MLMNCFSSAMAARVLVTALLLCACRPGAAGIFNKNQPPPDWGLEAAKTHVPEYAKDASSVILFDEYVETIDGQGRALEREREAIRVLKPQGRHNTCEVQYDEDMKVNYFRVWTIAADEKQYQAQDTDFVEEGDTGIPIMLSTYKRRVAHPPAVDVGATVICESEELMEPYRRRNAGTSRAAFRWSSRRWKLICPQGRAHAQTWHNFKRGCCGGSGAEPLALGGEGQAGADSARHSFAAEWGALAARMSVQWGDAAVDGHGQPMARALGSGYNA